MLTRTIDFVPATACTARSVVRRLRESAGMPLTYPQAFEDRLRGNRPLRAGIDKLAELFDGWLGSSRLPFFTDYTDHGIDHLNQVLATADHLITDPARKVFSAADAVVLTAATLFHDSALHLSEAGFDDLIRGKASAWAVREFDDPPWPELWDEFLFSAKRWDERRLRDVLGETPEGELRASIRDPFDNYHNLTDTDRKLIGEFIRRHHPRMAHEFALHGVPGRRLTSVAHTLGDDLRDLAGLVARSHGLPVRGCLPYLQSKYHRREYKEVHAVYLMTLLRVADYLQIHADRAPARVFDYRHIPSKSSVLELKAHDAIRNITQTNDDPESIEVQAAPGDVQTYLRLKDWLAGIQAELDASWAVLGETYGLQPELSRLGLILRRVRSNLDDPAAFAGTVEYVPERIELAVARPDLLKLLVGPLYDNVPSIGIRELMQNAVDAVREREVLQERHPELRAAPLIEQDHDVEIRLSKPDATGAAWLEVSDRGVGMTAATIRDYFLTAGASFRNSDAWKREFETDDAPRSRVLRSGRFGVGVLAGFLLGPRMEVATRHIRSRSGIRFSTTMDMNPIELRHDAGLRVGTFVRIPISARVREQLLDSSSRVDEPAKFDWYVYDRPTIERRTAGPVAKPKRQPRRSTRSTMANVISAEEESLKPRCSIRQPDPAEPSAFRLLRGDWGYSVYWTYQDLPALAVNGIFITNAVARARFYSDTLIKRDSMSGKTHLLDDMGGSINHPRLCIEDPDGHFPLNVRRSNITERSFPFQVQLVTDIIDDYLAYLVVHCPTHYSTALEWALNHPGVSYPSNVVCNEYELNVPPIITHMSGLSAHSLRSRPVSARDNCYLWFSGTQRDFPPQVLPQNYSHMVVSSCKPREHHSADRREYDRWKVNNLFAAIPYLTALDYVQFLGPNEAHRWDRVKHLRSLVGTTQVEGLRLVLPKSIADQVLVPEAWISRAVAGFKKRDDRKRITSTIRKLCGGITLESEHGQWAVLATPKCPTSSLDFKSLGSVRPTEGWLLEIVTKPHPWNVPSTPGLIAQRWNEVIRRPHIPFDLAARKRELSHAYEALDRFIRGHEAMKQAGVLH